MNRWMMPLSLALVFLFGGCAAIRDHKLEPYRTGLMTTYRDKTRSMDERVEAFDLLLDTFSRGTREDTIDRFTAGAAVSKSRIDGSTEDADLDRCHYSLRLLAPDGSDRWMQLRGDRVAH